MCACRCGIAMHLCDGELRYIDGNSDHPLNKGEIWKPALIISGFGEHHNSRRDVSVQDWVP